MGTKINELSAVTSLSVGDLLAIWNTSNGDTRKASLSALLTFVQENFASPEFTRQSSSPSATAFTVQVSDTGNNTWMILIPLGAYAAGTITLPALANCLDGQEIMVTCTQAVTSLTVDGNGAIAVNGAPTDLAANDYFKLRFDDTTQSWYRVG